MNCVKLLCSCFLDVESPVDDEDVTRLDKFRLNKVHGMINNVTTTS